MGKHVPRHSLGIDLELEALEIDLGMPIDAALERACAIWALEPVCAPLSV